MTKRETGQSRTGADTDLKARSSRGADAEAPAADDAKDTGDASYEELKKQLEAVKAELEALSHAMRKAGRATMQNAEDKAQKSARKTAAKTEEDMEHVLEQLAEALVHAESFARKRPALALGLSAAAGFILSLAMSRR